jgi:hypothetical protein
VVRHAHAYRYGSASTRRLTRSVIGAGAHKPHRPFCPPSALGLLPEPRRLPSRLRGKVPLSGREVDGNRDMLEDDQHRLRDIASGHDVEDDQALVGQVALHDRLDIPGADRCCKPILECPDRCLIVWGGDRGRRREASRRGVKPHPYLLAAVGS